MTKHDKNIVAEDPMAVLKTKNYTTDIASMKDKVSEAEWEARVNLAAAYRLVALWGMDEMIANHISVRVPGWPSTPPRRWPPSSTCSSWWTCCW